MNTNVTAEIYALRENIEPEEVINKIKDGLLSGRQIDGKWYVLTKDNAPQETKADQSIISKPEPLVQTLYTLGCFFLLGSFVICLVNWPESTYSRTPALREYTLSIIWLAAGIIECALFYSIGKGLHYLRQIAENTKK